MEQHLLKMKSRSRDHKGTLIGQKHTLNDALRQTKECINNLKRELLGNSDIELGQDANAAEVLDLDRTEGMRSETIIGNSRNSWKNAPLNLPGPRPSKSRCCPGVPSKNFSRKRVESPRHFYTEGFRDYWLHWQHSR